MSAVVRIGMDKNNLYCPGQMITGSLQVCLTKPQKVKCIFINFKGRAKVRWEESHGKKPISYSAEEIYFESGLFLLGSPFLARGKVLLAVGDHCYPFEFKLPYGIPSSFEGVHGNIRYTIKAIVERYPWKADCNNVVELRVVAPLDLTTIPQILQNHFQLEKTKQFCCIWCVSGFVRLTVTIPSSAYVSGEIIRFDVEVENSSRVSVHVFNFYFIQETTWKAWHQGKSKKRITDLQLRTESLRLCVGSHDTRTFGTEMHVPHGTPSNMSMSCDIIDVKFYLQVEVEFEGVHSNLMGRIPILLGTSPLQPAPVEFRPGTAIGSADDISYPVLENQQHRVQVLLNDQPEMEGSPIDEIGMEDVEL